MRIASIVTIVVVGANPCACATPPAPAQSPATASAAPIAVASGETAAPRPAAAPPVPALAVEAYSYADGAGNRYTLDLPRRKLTYVPLRKEESSSGLYDGGPAWNRELTDAEAEALVGMFERAIADKDAQTIERAKGTGIVMRRPGGETTILRMNAPIRTEVEAKLWTYFPTPKK